MSINLDIHAVVVGLLLIGWLVVRLVTEYLFRIEHKPRMWVHQVCFVVYRAGCKVSRFFHRFQPNGWLSELPYKLMPLPLCRIAMDMMQEGEL